MNQTLSVRRVLSRSLQELFILKRSNLQCKNLVPCLSPYVTLGIPILHQSNFDHLPCGQSRRKFHSSPVSSMMTEVTIFGDNFNIAEVNGRFGNFKEIYEHSINEPEKFWAKAAEELEWFQKPQKILEYDESNPHFYRWFPDGVINTCYNCLDVHVKNGRSDQVALYYDSPVTGLKKQYTYKQMLDKVAALAGGLRDLGVEPGDRVVIYMPMMPAAIMAMLACTRIGAVHSVVFGGFAAKELATRIQDCKPKVVISATAGVEPTRIVPYKPLLEEALEIASQTHVEHTIIKQRPTVLECELESNQLDFDEIMSNGSPINAVPLPANHPHYILYTSGTTGKPKGVVRDTASMAVALKKSMSVFYDNDPGDVFWAASDIGWVVGHSYIVYAPLLHGCSTVLYEGKPVGTPDAGAFWRIIEEYKVKTLFVAPTAFRAIKQADSNAEFPQKYDLSSLRALFLAGEHSDPDTLKYCEKSLKNYGDVRFAIDHWWQTELGHPGVGNSIGLGRFPFKPGACAAPALGFDIRIVDDYGNEVPRGELGDMVIRAPLAPGSFITLYQNDERFIKEYFTKYPGFYDTGDAAFLDTDGYYHIMGRTDDVINTAGHRLSTGGIEEILQSHPEVADCAVVGLKDDLKGEVPIGFVITNKGCTMENDELEAELIELVRNDLGPVASFKKVGVVTALPKTRSGKILRGTMALIANGKPYKITPTIEDPDVFNYLEPEIKKVVGR